LPAGNAKVIRLDETNLGSQHYKYLYQWYNPDAKPKAIVIAVHGLSLHGLVYDGLARHLAGEGMLVLAPDLPGYGRRNKKEISYSQAIREIADIIQAARANYKNLPIICLGESLGSNLTVYAVQSRSIPVDGLILSSPALKPRLHLNPWLVKNDVNMLVGLIDANATMNMSPYLKAYVSENPAITKAVLNDPLVRTQLSCQDIWHTYEMMQPLYKQAGLIKSSTAILIMQGNKDRVLKSNAIIKLVSNLNANDLTIKWFKDRGHLIVEAPAPQIDVLQTIDEWLQFRINEPLLQAQATTPQRLSAQTTLSSVGEGAFSSVTATMK
jgi:alpha-beta hydrolase superfamily lysophospholipase